MKSTYTPVTVSEREEEKFLWRFRDTHIIFGKLKAHLFAVSVLCMVAPIYRKTYCKHVVLILYSKQQANMLRGIFSKCF